jgi:hypothetical protein
MFLFKRYSMSLVVITTLLFFSSCDKIHVKKLAGKYNCKVKGHYYNMINGGYSYDTTYTETVEVKQEGVFVNVKGFKVHIDSLWKGKKYWASVSGDHRSLQFVNDSLYYYAWSGGQGGGGSQTYEGKKIK